MPWGRIIVFVQTGQSRSNVDQVSGLPKSGMIISGVTFQGLTSTIFRQVGVNSRLFGYPQKGGIIYKAEVVRAANKEAKDNRASWSPT